MGKIGWFFFLAGVVVCGYAFSMNVGIPVPYSSQAVLGGDFPKVLANSDLMAQPQMVLSTGLVGALIGALLIVGYEICLAIRGREPGIVV